MKNTKPKLSLIENDGMDVLVLIGLASKALKRANLDIISNEMTIRLSATKSYGEALTIVKEYCEIE